MKSEIRKEIIRLLKEDESFRYEVLGLLGIRDLMDELKKLREDFNRFIRLSERRWRVNEKRWRENAKLWEENFKRWEENDRRWKENEKRWEENEKRWQENFKRWENADKTFKWLINALTDIRDALGGGFEYYCGRVVKLLMKERGIDCDIKVNVTLPIDGYKEVDIFCSDPLIVGEVTVTLRSIEEAKNQLEKLNIAVNSAEKFTNKKTYLKVLSVEFANEEVANYLKEKCKEEGIYLILGREYSLGVPLY
jgi:DNA repair exonuclease SbcCD ATPase subunit